MKHLRFPALAVLLVWALAACLPGLGTIQPVSVTAETPHIAVATFTPSTAVTDVIVNFAGGNIDHVRPVDTRFQCQAFRSGWDCFVTGQDDSRVPRVVHPAGQALQFVIYAGRADSVVASVTYKR